MIINRQNNVSELKKAFFSIFRNCDPFDQMLLSQITSKVILYPTNSYHLSEKQFIALMSAMKIAGEQSFYFAEIEVNPFVINNTLHDVHVPQYLELSVATTYQEYAAINLIYENALYSLNGTWGVIISHEGHAVLGGNTTFITTFKNLYPDWMSDQKEFVAAMMYWATLSKADVNWLSHYIKYINT